jgi:hypothetical protein
MNTCQIATERLLVHWSASEPRDTEEIQTAIEHIRHCPQCRGRLGHLIRVLSTDVEDRLTCEECEALLPEYILAKQNGADEEARWQPVTEHLASCPHCALAYAEWTALSEGAYGTPGQRPTPAPAPDLSFLPTVRSEPARLIVELTDQLLGTLLPPAHQPAHALARLKSAAPGTLFELPIQVPDADLNVTIQAEGEHAAPGRCTLCVRVDIPSRGGWPHLAGTEVTLKQDGHEPSLAWTDAYGKAVFESVPIENLAGLVIDIMPGK